MPTHHPSDPPETETCLSQSCDHAPGCGASPTCNQIKRVTMTSQSLFDPCEGEKVNGKANSSSACIGTGTRMAGTDGDIGQHRDSGFDPSTSAECGATDRAAAVLGSVEFTKCEVSQVGRFTHATYQDTTRAPTHDGAQQERASDCDRAGGGSASGAGPEYRRDRGAAPGGAATGWAVVPYMSTYVRAERLRHAIRQVDCARVSTPWLADFDALAAKLSAELAPLDALLDEMEQV